MKRIGIFSILFFVLCYSLLGQVVYENEYYCGFETEEEFKASWKTSTIDDTEWKWQSGKYIELWTSNGWFTDPPHNSWMISPKINITDINNLCVRILIHSGLSQESLKITMGKEPNEESQTIIINDWNSCFTRTTYPEYYIFNLPKEIDSGEYYFGIQGYTPAMSSYIHIYSFELLSNSFSSVSGIVSNDKGEILKQTQIKISGEKYKEYTSITDDSGKYLFENLSPGDYELKVEIPNHEIYKDSITIIEGEELSKDINLLYHYKGTVSGTVQNINEMPIENADIILYADKTYKTKTNADGYFNIEDVSGSNNDYTIRVEKDLKKTYNQTFKLTDSPVDLGIIVLENNVMKPQNISVTETQQGNLISWMLPLRETELRYDDGKYNGQIVVKGGNKAALGVRFSQPVILNGLKWVVTSDYEDETVGICVFSLDKNGEITDNILYEETDVPTLKYPFEGDVVWTECIFDKSIEAGYGCLAVIYGENLYLAHDSGTDPEYPFSYQYFIANDYINDDYVSPTFIGNVLFRGIGYLLGIPHNIPGLFKSKAVTFETDNSDFTEEVGYEIWRLTEEQFENIEESKSEWISLKNNINEPSYLDRGFNTLEQGYYYYAVNATYDDGQVSEYSFSDKVEKNMRTDITFFVSSKTGIGLVDGALVEIQNKENPLCSYVATVENETAIFENVLKGQYNISISSKGFEPIADEADFSKENIYSKTYEMVFIPESPVNLKAEQYDNKVILSWNNVEAIEENFEGMPDFAINEPGDVGWQYIDADQVETYMFGEVTKPFDNMGEAMAFMVFNPSKTVPSLFKYVNPHSGDKVLVDIAVDASLSNGKHNDDYIFSPELSFKDNFIFSFWAVAGYSGMVAGNEQFMVGYTEYDVSEDNIIWFSEDIQEVGGKWTQFRYEVPSEAKHVVIRCVSDQRFIFAIDDIYIGYEKTKANEIATYDVYIDEELIGQTATEKYEIVDLEAGTHLAKVQAVYTNIDGTNMYSDEKELVFEVKSTSGVSEIIGTGKFLYNEHEKYIYAFGAEYISITSADGVVLGEYFNTNHIDLDFLSQGIYIVKVKCLNKINTYKILVK